MKEIKITRSHLGENPFVNAAEEVFAYWGNPYPDVRYEFDGNEVFIDYEYYTLDPDVQKYLYDLKDQIDNKPLRDIEFVSKTMFVINANDLDCNKGLSEDDDDYEYNGKIRFEVENGTL